MQAANKRLEICVVEDEADFREEIVEALREAGFGVRDFPGSRELYAALLAAPCDILILDVGLPGEDGFSVAERLRGLGSMGIIMLTARGQTEDRVRALLGGADMYLVKPVDLRELVASIGSLARRLHLNGLAGVAEGAVDGRAQDNPRSWSLSPDGWTLFDPEGSSIPLTAQERGFLQCRGPGPVRPYPGKIWRWPWAVTPMNTISTASTPWSAACGARPPVRAWPCP